MEVVITVMLILPQLCYAYHLGFFVPLRYRDPNFDNTMDGISYPHALTIAVDDVNNDSNILPGQNLTYSWTDSTDSKTVPRTMYEKYISGKNGPVDAFIGPAFKCTAPAQIAASFDVPMISYYCYEGEHFTKQEYPLFIQTFQNTNTQAASALFTLLKKQNWKRIGILYEEGSNYWIDLKTTVLKRATEYGLQIVSRAVPNANKFNDYGEIINEFPPMVQRNKSLQLTRDVLRKLAVERQIKVFVLLTTFDLLNEIMAEAYLMGLTELNRPHRAFIGFQLDAAKRRKTYFRQSHMFYNLLIMNEKQRRLLTMKGARSLLIISVAEPKNTVRYDKFRKELIRRTEYDLPFNDTTAYYSLDEDIAEIAPALYDAVYQYALALDRLQKQNVSITAQAVVETFRNTPYVGMSGYRSVFLAKDGSLQVHLSLLHLEKEVTKETYLSLNPETIGSFEYSESSGIELEIYNGGQILWPWGTTRPTDQLTCEDDNHECPNVEENATSIVLPIILSAVFASIFLVLLFLFLRQWRRECKLKRSVWQIEISEIMFDRKVSTESKFSDDSGIRCASETELCSLFSDSSKDFFTNGAIAEEMSDIMSLKSIAAIKSTSGHYKGDRVFVKVLPRNVDITKPMRRELRMLRRIHHENLNPFIGLGIEASYIWIVMQLGCKGTLEEVLANPDVSLDHRFILSLVYDLSKGMTFLHNSDIKSHGNLKSSNCVVDNRWVLKITDYGIPEVRSRQARYLGPSNEDRKLRDLLWKAPELLRETDPPLCGTRKGDVYSFSIILEEFHTFKSPYSNCTISARSIIDRIVDGEVPPYRPVVTQPIENAERLLDLMKDCWRENPEKRPSFQEIKCEVEGAMTRCGLKTDICDNMITLLENYSNDLENVVSERTRQLRDEKYKTEALLDRMLPRSVADQLKRGETVQAESFSSVTIYFSDIVQFTALCAESTPMEVVDMLNDLYLLFDDIIMDYSVYKVETIGDAYMVVSGLPMRNGKLHASEICCMALEILDNVKSFKVRHKPEHELQVRIGIHTGPVVAGVVGMTMPRYCLFGDTVNTASRMESNGKQLQIHVSKSTKEVLDELGGFYLRQRLEKVHLKGKGYCTTFWLYGASPDVPRCPRKLSKKAMKPLFQNLASRKYSQPFRTRKKTQGYFPRASVA